MHKGGFRMWRRATRRVLQFSPGTPCSAAVVVCGAWALLGQAGSGKCPGGSKESENLIKNNLLSNIKQQPQVAVGEHLKPAKYSTSMTDPDERRLNTCANDSKCLWYVPLELGSQNFQNFSQLGYQMGSPTSELQLRTTVTPRSRSNMTTLCINFTKAVHYYDLVYT